MTILNATKWTPHWMIILFGGLFVLYNNPLNFVSANGNIGCLFADTLCVEHLEWCYDDFAFGKCLPQYGLEPEELFREPLDAEQTQFLAVALEELQRANLEWEHPFTQCQMQGILVALRSKTTLPSNSCNDLLTTDEVLDGRNPLAFVSFNPSNDDYADELYYPPTKKQHNNQKAFRRSQKSESTSGRPVKYAESESDGPYSKPGADFGLENLNSYSAMDIFNNDEYSQPELKNTKSFFKEQQENIDETAVREVMSKLMSEMDYNKELLSELQIPQNNYQDVQDEHVIPSMNIQNADGNNYNLNDLPANDYFFRKFTGFQNRPLHLDQHDFENNNEIPTNLNNNMLHDSDPSDGMYTEGGLVYVLNSDANDAKMENKENAREMLANMLGFTRHERLDVKKPGPPAGPPASQLTDELDKTSKGSNDQAMNGLSIHKEKKTSVIHASDDHAPHSVDSDYAHVIFKNPLDSWGEGARIVTAIGEMLNMEKYLTHYRVDRHEVSFFVEDNPEKKTATDIAKAINDSRFKVNLSRRLGITVVRAGIGDKTKEINFDSVQSAKLKKADEGPDVAHVMAYMFAGAGVAAFIVIVITIFLIKKNDKKRDKLGDLQSKNLDTETCCKDYGDMCRTLMSGKTKTAEPARVSNLSKESEAKPPSSRSSTSSWSEEPALTNMDISTGHMVLSYMEDHLRNKGRLQREWEALCRYEAEPGARDFALQPQCVPLNRADAPLPFDHSRVVLNHLANAEGIDYINASTITDHDPRAPAYVAAQAPLPTTLAHFWQMVWEQGAVVLVALCRLQENGDTSCARYWPEEGSEIYHIYEVHLVSEHTWCDDYLVRSFYLKNLRTSETRTVTQFHFLSWPHAGVPASAKALLEFRRKVNKSYRGRSCPIVVHSSLGSGRTGAYILLDLVLGRMNKGAREIDIAATLEHLRDQRSGLVATRQQFEFVLMAVAEEVHAILKALPQNTQNEKRDLEKETAGNKEPEKAQT